MKNDAPKILMVTSEAVPFAKAGGLGDVISPLSLALKNVGLDVRIIMPRYYFIDKKPFRQTGIKLNLSLGRETDQADILEYSLNEGEVPVYFLENEKYYGRDGIYGTREEPFFQDNLKRFSLLSLAAFSLGPAVGFSPDVIHAHDWPAGLVPLYRNRGVPGIEGAGPATIFTIHNLGYQGIFSFSDAFSAGLSYEEVYRFGLARGDTLNILQGALINSDLLTTVSPTYAKEIQTSEQGHGMEGILGNRAGDLTGIINGIDYSIWNPETDPHLPFHYNHLNLSPKNRIKAFLQKELGLPLQPQVPLIGIVSRMVSQKGFVELCAPGSGSLARILKDMKVQFAILGTGELWIEEELMRLYSEFPNLSVTIGFNDRLAHLIEAGSDFFLMPSRYEPCGLNQLYSLRYGTLPIVRRTGGLADTVENYRESTGEGTGFMFDSLSPDVLYDVTGWAVHTWYNRKSHINRMRRRAMTRRFSWQDQAASYIPLYLRGMDKHHRRG